MSVILNYMIKCSEEEIETLFLMNFYRNLGQDIESSEQNN